MMRRLTALVLVAAAAAAPARADVVTVATHALQLRDDVVPPVNPKSRKLSFAVRTTADASGHRVVFPAIGGAGDPTLYGARAVVYNANGSGEQVVVDLPAAAWHHEGHNYPPDDLGRWVFTGLIGGVLWPIQKVYVKRDKITIRGGNAPWTYTLDAPSQGAVAVQLTLGTGDTWCAVGVPRSPAATYDRPGRFIAQMKTPAPDACPPAP